MSVVVKLFSENPDGEYPRTKGNVFSLTPFFTLDQITKIINFHNITSGYTELIQGRRKLINMDILDSGDSCEDGAADDYGDSLDEQDEGGSVEAGTSTDVKTEDNKIGVCAAGFEFYSSFVIYVGTPLIYN